MVILVASVGALCAWIILWAFGIKGVEGIPMVLIVVAAAVGIQHMISALTSPRE